MTAQLRLGIDVACREPHRAALADDTGKILWSNRRFTTTSAELEALWVAVRAADTAAEIVVVNPRATLGCRWRHGCAPTARSTDGSA